MGTLVGCCGARIRMGTLEGFCGALTPLPCPTEVGTHMGTLGGSCGALTPSNTSNKGEDAYWDISGDTYGDTEVAKWGADPTTASSRDGDGRGDISGDT